MPLYIKSAIALTVGLAAIKYGPEVFGFEQFVLAVSAGFLVKLTLDLLAGPSR